MRRTQPTLSGFKDGGRGQECGPPLETKIDPPPIASREMETSAPQPNSTKFCPQSQCTKKHILS